MDVHHPSLLTVFKILPHLLQVIVSGNVLGGDHDHRHEHDKGSEEGLELAAPSGKVPTNFKLTIVKGSGRNLGKIKNGRKFQRRRRKGKNSEGSSNEVEERPRRPFQFRIPRTGFSCKHRAPGYYADVEADCLVSVTLSFVLGELSHQT